MLQNVLLMMTCLCSMWTAGLALKCYSCQSSKIASKSGSLASFLAGGAGAIVEDKACDEAGIFDIGNLPTSECGDDHVCGDMRASLTLKETLTGGEVKIESVGRGCMPQGSQAFLFDHCEEGPGAVKSAANVLLSVLNELPTIDIKVDGEVCYCQTDLCSAGSCADDSFKIAGYCVKIWLVAVPAGVLVLLIALCCCCCCCCCNKKPQPFVIQQVQPGMAVVTYSPVPNSIDHHSAGGYPLRDHSAGGYPLHDTYGLRPPDSKTECLGQGGPPYVRFDGQQAQFA